jgi:hypothetical protein
MNKLFSVTALCLPCVGVTSMLGLAFCPTT